MTREEKSSVLGHEPFTFEQMKEIEAMHLQHDWDALRNQAAIAAMQGFIQSKNVEFYSLEDVNKWQKVIIHNSVVMADALIEELKKK